MKSNLQKEFSDLESKTKQLSRELVVKAEKLSEMEDEILNAQADAYMSPVIYQSMYDSIYSSDDKETVKDFALKKLSEYFNRDNSENREKILKSLKQFINEELNFHSNYKDLIDYRLYLFEISNKEMGINVNE